MSKKGEEPNFTSFAKQPKIMCVGSWIANDKYGIKLYTKDGALKYNVGLQPILITKRIINDENETESFEIAYKDQDKWKTRDVPRMYLFNKTLVTKLGDYGIDVSSTTVSSFVAYMTDLYTFNKDMIPVEYSRNHLGWLDDKCNRIIPYDKEVRCDAGKGLTRFVEAFHSKGNEEEWLRRIKNVRKNERIRLYTDASLAAPLLKIVNGLGFITHLWGGSGNGKSVALYAALSIWGDPAKLFLTLTATNLSLELIAHVLQNFPMAGDELTQLDSKTMTPQDVAYLFSNGHGKNRGTKDGELQETKEWKTLMLSTGEAPFVDESSDGGAVARVLEIESTENMYPTEPNLREFVSFLCENYGFVGEKYINYLISLGKSKIQERYKEESQAFLEQCKKDNLNEKQAVSMSLIKFADELARECIFIGEEELDENVFLSFTESRDNVSSYKRAYELVLQSAMRDKNTLIITNEDNETIGVDENKYGKTNGFWDMKNERLFLYETYVNEILRKENSKWSFGQFKKMWLENGLIIPGENGRYVKKTRKLDRRAICFIFEEESEEEIAEEPPF